MTTLYQAETGLRYETDDSTIPSFALSLDGTFIDADSGQTTLSVEIERIGRQDLESSVIIQLGPYNISTHESSDETLPRIEDPICRFLTDQSSVFVDVLLPTGIVQELTLQLAAPVNGEISTLRHSNSIFMSLSWRLKVSTWSTIMCLMERCNL